MITRAHSSSAFTVKGMRVGDKPIAISNGDFSRTIPSFSWLVFRFAETTEGMKPNGKTQVAHVKVGGGGGYCRLATNVSVSIKMISLYRVVA